MQEFEKVKDLKAYINKEKSEGKTIGFVPTMGALHSGHLSLVEIAKKESDIVVVSIFVNPTQFNDPKDLENYPRTLENDLLLLKKCNTSAVFYPSKETIYPEKDTRLFSIGKIGEVMEGAFRPGHFNGVMQVVSRLFDIVEPDKAFFGEKDFQQIAVIKAMLKITKQEVNIVSCPIHRADNGLALSSRNALLSTYQLEVAPIIYKTLKQSLSMSKERSPRQIIEWVTNEINKHEELRVEYFDIVDRDSLQSISNWDESSSVQGCITVYCGGVRLIDNIRYK